MNAPLVGQALRRVEARSKVTGATRYASDRLPHGCAHAALVTATAAKGRITAIDTGAARRVPGVLHVMTHEERRPAIHPVVLEMELTFGRRTHEDMPPLQGAEIHYSGQVVAMVTAETACHAASLVTVAYQAEPSTVVPDFAAALPGAIHIPKVKGEDTDQVHGDPETELAASACVVDALYTTPAEHHAAMELHAKVAEWQGDGLVMHEATQWVRGTGRALAQALGVPDDKVRLLNPFVGGGFGGKAYFRYDSALCAIAARDLGRPVKLVLSREQVFVLGGARPATRQRLALGADASGRLRAVIHDSWTAVSTVDTNYQETCGYQTRQLYATRALRTTHRVVPFDIASTCPMRAPGSGPGSFALESAMDKLACRLGIDPVELRLRNYAEQEPGTGRPFSPKHLRDCYAIAAERINWPSRSPRPGARPRAIGWSGWAWRRRATMSCSSRRAPRWRCCATGRRGSRRP
jgi:xanthine dehydrogenase YagR molybdenum-binding subunit